MCDRYVVLVSGLELGGADERLFSLQLLLDLLTGQLGDADQQRASSQIARVIIAGNSLSRATQDRDSLSKVKAAGARFGIVVFFKKLTKILCDIFFFFFFFFFLSGLNPNSGLRFYESMFRFRGQNKSSVALFSGLSKVKATVPFKLSFLMKI